VAVAARANHDVVAVSRNPKPLQIDGRKIQTEAADFNEEAALARILEGADTILLNLPSTSFNEAGPIIAATKAIAKVATTSGVKLLVFNTSMPVPEESHSIKAQDDRRKMRAILRESGLPVISIQPIVYLDNLLEGWALPPIRDYNKVVYCHKPTLDVSWVCHHDVAQLMVAAMERPDLAGRNFEVAGPETVRLHQLTEKLSRVWGRKLNYECQTVADFCEKISATMQGRGLDVERIKNQMFKAYTWYNESPTLPFHIDMRPVLEELPVTLTPIEEWAKTHFPPGWK
jgi:uncharacterized protein YbjT (DUF2867 family)